MMNAVITFEVMAINEDFVTIRLLSRIEGLDAPLANQVHCLRVGDTLNIPVEFEGGSAMSKAVLIASGYCDKAVAAKRSVDEIMAHLEKIFDDDNEPVILNKGEYKEIRLVYDDSRPSELIYRLPKGYK